jgi:hypothetical protein
MRVSSSARTAIAMAVLVSCGGGGSEGEDDGSADDSGIVITGGYEPPPSDFDRPPGQDTPPSDYDDPDRGCAPLCEVLYRKGCTAIAPTLDACTSACVQGIGSASCAGELLGLVTCVVNAATFTCDLLADFELPQSDFEECPAQIDAYDRCSDDGGGEGGQGGM